MVSYVTPTSRVQRLADPRAPWRQTPTARATVVRDVPPQQQRPVDLEQSIAAIHATGQQATPRCETSTCVTQRVGVAAGPTNTKGKGNAMRTAKAWSRAESMNSYAPVSALTTGSGDVAAVADRVGFRRHRHIQRRLRAGARRPGFNPRPVRPDRRLTGRRRRGRTVAARASTGREPGVPTNLRAENAAGSRWPQPRTETRTRTRTRRGGRRLPHPCCSKPTTTTPVSRSGQISRGPFGRLDTPGSSEGVPGQPGGSSWSCPCTSKSD